jgi:hypothetical protein
MARGLEPGLPDEPARRASPVQGHGVFVPSAFVCTTILEPCERSNGAIVHYLGAGRGLDEAAGDRHGLLLIVEPDRD